MGKLRAREKKNEIMDVFPHTVVTAAAKNETNLECKRFHQMTTMAWITTMAVYRLV